MNNPANDKGIYLFKILRYDSQQPEVEPYFASYRIRAIPGLTVLSVLLRIRDELDGSLAFRSSCRAATCGSCAMVINGKLDLACRTQVTAFGEKTIILEPLPNLEVIKDLVVDLTPFWNVYEKIQPYLVRKNQNPAKEIFQTEEDRQKIDQFVNCILCACCYGACPVLNRESGYVGPAAFAKLQRFMLDSRDERPASILEGMNHEKGLWACDTLFKCVDACPKEVRPADAIVGLRKRLVRHKVRTILGLAKNED